MGCHWHSKIPSKYGGWMMFSYFELWTADPVNDGSMVRCGLELGDLTQMVGGDPQEAKGFKKRNWFFSTFRTSERESISVFLCGFYVWNLHTLALAHPVIQYLWHTKDWNLTTRGPANLAFLVVLVGELCYSRSRRWWLWLPWWFGGALSWLSLFASSEAIAFVPISQNSVFPSFLSWSLLVFPLMCNLKHDL